MFPHGGQLSQFQYSKPLANQSVVPKCSGVMYVLFFERSNRWPGLIFFLLGHVGGLQIVGAFKDLASHEFNRQTKASFIQSALVGRTWERLAGAD